MPPLRTLHQAFDDAARGQTGYCFSSGDTDRWETYASLRCRGLQVARSLRDAGVRRGHLVALILPDAEAFLIALLGTSLSGATPASFAPPAATVGLPRYLDRAQPLLRLSGARAVLTNRRIAAAFADSRASAASASADRPLLLVLDDLDAAGCEPDVAPALGDVALVQFTSGSTSSPKGVTLTHANLAANIEAFGGACGIDAAAEDVGVSWLPLSHDMGLVGMALGALYAARPCVLMPPHEFVKRPASWLRAIARHRGTVSFAPNFGYELCARRVTELAGIDLSSWRVAGCGAEPIHAATLTAFAARFSPAGFRDTAFVPCYGLAEHVLAATVSPLARRPRVEYVLAHDLAERRLAAGGANADRTVALVSCGPPLSSHQLRIVDDDGRAVAERHVGEIQLAGPSVMAGYHNEPALTAETIRGGWLRTGDLGYLSNGELFVCGRAKDAIIVHGRTYQSEDLEWTAGQVLGVRPGRVAAFGSAGPEGDRLVILVERDGTVEPAAIVDGIRREIADVFGLVLDEVLVVRSGAIARTTSGKVQRAAMRTRYERGELAPDADSVVARGQSAV